VTADEVPEEPDSGPEEQHGGEPVPEIPPVPGTLDEWRRAFLAGELPKPGETG
jgi:hypothetical protein